MTLPITQTKPSLSSALNIIEKWRYRFSMDSAFSHFILEWAFRHSELYPVSRPEFENDAFNSVAIELSHELSRLMATGYHDPIGDLLGEMGIYKHQQFFPTPAEVSRLLSSLAGGRVYDFYEPCLGTGSITMARIEDTYLSRIDDDNPLKGCRYICEELNPVNCAAAYIQILHKLDYLERIYGKPAVPDEIMIANIDVLSRKPGRQHYLLQSPEIA
ncbi:hypothetical protein [uncultured Photobacterium sp.]|uniref:hypothetical protein n=1 Tax=uncultured Photobacterium sp. TaxID=173973 RepID=UPI002631DB9C|nr:hypothetical protein [uncultured Photobacterium sp.]